MNNYIPSEIEGLIAATSKLKDALVSVQNDLASQVIGKCFKIKGITNARIVAVNPETKKIVFETVESVYDHRNHLWCIIKYEETNLSTVWESKDLYLLVILNTITTWLQLLDMLELAGI